MLGKVRKGLFSEKKVKACIVISLFIFVTILFLQNDANVYLRFSGLSQDSTISIYPDYGEGFSESTVLKKRVSAISQKQVKIKISNLREIKNIRMDYDGSSEIAINSISFGTRFFQIKEWSQEKLAKYLESTKNISSKGITNEGILFKSNVDDPQIYFSQDAVNEVRELNYKTYKLIELSILFLIILSIILLIKLNNILGMVNFYKKYRDRLDRMFSGTLKGILCFSLLIVFIISMHSQLNNHPDELVSYFAADYYTDHWMPPDLRDPAITHTFSVYGNSRLSESSPYYLIVGKISALMTYIVGGGSFFRIVNFIMLLTMVSIFLLRYKKYPYLGVVLCLTPQLWYIYSYVTSDGWDFFISFLALYQFVKKESMLNKVLREPLCGKNTLRISMISLLFALIFMAKPNYYVMLLLFFFILLFKLMDSEKSQRMAMFSKFLIMLSFVFLFVGLRMIPDFVHYGTEGRSAIKAEMIEATAQYEFKPSTPMNEKYAGLSLHDRGVGIKELLISRGWIEFSIKSFMGVYGYMEFYANPTFYSFLAFLYLVIYGFIVYYGFTANENRKRMLFFISQMIVLISVGLSVYNSWFLDFQPQGRYLLPSLLILAYSTTLNKKIYQNIAFKSILTATCVLSLYSLLAVGLINVV